MDSVTKWAMELMAQEQPDWVVMDTETTGVGSDDEIIDLAIIDSRGESLFSNLIRPFKRISEEATRIHGIHDEKLRSGPSRARSFAEYWPEIYRVLKQYRRVISYNAEFDYRLFKQTAKKAGLSLFMSTRATQLASDKGIALPLEWECLMLKYAVYHGAPGRFGNFAWQKLEVACSQLGVEIDTRAIEPDAQPGNGRRLWHSAFSDAQATLGLLKQLAALGTSQALLEQTLQSHQVATIIANDREELLQG